MKKLFGAAVILAMTSGIYVPQVEAGNVAQSICGYVQSDHKSRLRDQLRANKIKLKRIYSGLTCNNSSLLRFAMLNDADNAGAFIAKRLSVKLLSGAEPDGKTILQWASENGKDASGTVKAIRKRMKI